MPSPQPVAVVLAAGKSTRMKSALPKVLHPIWGRPMIDYVLDAARSAGVGRVVVIVGHEADRVKGALSAHGDVEFALQTEQKGTGHAVMMAADALAGHDGPVLILAGDTPLLRGETLVGLLADQREHAAACVIGTAVTDNNQGLGRVVRDEAERFVKIVEQKDCTPVEASIREINTGCYAFDSRRLFEALKEVRPTNKQGELYLTDAPAILKRDGHAVVASPRFDLAEAMGVNTRAQLADVARALHDAALARYMADGVTIVSPERTVIDPRAKIAADTTIHPFTTITGPAVIGTGCTLGPHAVVEGPVHLRDGATVAPFERIAATG